MSEADELSSLAADLRALSGGQRRAVFRELTDFERAQVEALLARDEESAEPVQPMPQDMLAQFSPWLAKRLLRAISADERPGNRGSVTAATRKLIATLVCDAQEASIATAANAHMPAMSRSLLGTMGKVLGGGLDRP